MEERCEKCQGCWHYEYGDWRCLNCGWRGWPRQPTPADLTRQSALKQSALNWSRRHRARKPRAADREEVSS